MWGGGKMKEMKYFLSFSLSLFILSSNVYAVTSYESCSYYKNSSPFQGYIEDLTVVTDAFVFYPETVTPNSAIAISIENMEIDCDSLWNIAGISTPSCPQTLDGIATLGDIKFGSLYASRENPNFNQIFEVGQSSNSYSSVFFGSLATQSFTAPSAPGTQTISGVCSVDRRNHPFQRSYQVVPTACSDSINNDGQQGADTLDPQCHTDCNVNNAASYVSSHTSEATPPNGSCPAPTLNLTGKAVLIIKSFLALLTNSVIAETR